MELSHLNHWCAVLFSQLRMWEEGRYSAVDRVKTTDVDLPTVESRKTKKRIKRFQSVLCPFFFSFGSYIDTVLGIVLRLQVSCISW